MLKLLQKKISPSESHQLFLAILLLESSVQAVLWTVANGQIKILEKSDQRSYTNDNDCLIKIDLVLQELGPQSEGIDEVIFVFEPEWVINGDIIKLKKPLLKKITTDLSLKPLGFVILTEALGEHFVKANANESLLLVYLSPANLNLALFRNGSLVSGVRFGQSGQITADLAEGLARLSKKIKQANKLFPGKIYLSSLNLSAEQLEEKQQQLITHQWQDNYFAQTPMIEIFPAPRLFQVAVLEAGRVVAQAKNLPLQGARSNLQAKSQQVNHSGSASHDLSSADSATTADTDQVSLDQTHMSSFGVPITNMVANKYIVGQKYDNLAIPQDPVSSNQTNSSFLKLKTKSKFILPKKLKHIIWLGVAAGAFIFVLLSYVWLNFFSNLIIVITPDTKIIAKEVEITLDPDISVSNPQKLILKANLVTKQYIQKGLDATTGEKIIGEKAKGKVTIFNKTTDVKVFNRGTVLSYEGKEFTLDEDVKVASASVTSNESGDGETKEYGKAEVSILAEQVGEESNLAKDTKLTIADYDSSTYAAEVATELSGGVSKEVQVVSQKDRTNLLVDVREEIKKQAEKDFTDKSGDGIYYILTGEMTNDEIKFDALADEETDVLNLELTVTVTAIQYSGDDLKPLAEFVLAEEVPEGYQLLDKDPEILSAPKKETDSSTGLILEANVQSTAVAQLDLDQLQNQVQNLQLDTLNQLAQEEKIKNIETFFDPYPAVWLVRQVPKKANRLKIIIKE